MLTIKKIEYIYVYILYLKIPTNCQNNYKKTRVYQNDHPPGYQRKPN
jgi:hypothetical protein